MYEVACGVHHCIEGLSKSRNAGPAEAAQVAVGLLKKVDQMSLALPLFLKSALEVVAAMAPPAVSAKGEAPASVAVEAVDVKCEAVDGQAAASGAAAASS